LACPLPRRSLDATRAALPEPSAASEFEFYADAFLPIRPIIGNPNGWAHVLVTAGRFHGLSAWRVLQQTMERGDEPRSGSRLVSRTAWLSRDLHVLASDLVDGGLHETALAVNDGTVVTRTEGGTTVLVTLPGRLDGLGTLAGALLFFRGCPAERAAFGEPPWCPIVWSVGDDGSLSCTIPTKQDASIQIYFNGPGRRPTFIDRSTVRSASALLVAVPLFDDR
jgi:hypothetical protein